jgi:hypothetical protein
MIRNLRHILFALLLFTTNTFGQQQTTEDTWARYKPGKLSSIIKAHTNVTDTLDKGVYLGSDPVRAQVTYTGLYRPTSAEKQRFIAFYMDSVRTPEFAKKFVTELLFIEDGMEFWLPVQDVLLPSFEKEVRKGERVILFANWIGITYPELNGSRLHVFLVNEFEKLGTLKSSRPANEEWGTLTGPDRDFAVDFPVEPERDEFRAASGMGKAGHLVRRYRAYTDKAMLVITFEDLAYPANSPFADIVASTYEQKIRKAARQKGWKIIRIQRLSNSAVETEAWERLDKPAGYVHTISRTVIRNGQVYDLQCRSMFIGQEVDKPFCQRFLNSFRIIGPPQ